LALSVCGCGSSIAWITTDSGAKMPVDPDVVSIMVSDNKDLPQNERRYHVERGFITHYATCADAEKYRKKK